MIDFLAGGNLRFTLIQIGHTARRYQNTNRTTGLSEPRSYNSAAFCNLSIKILGKSNVSNLLNQPCKAHFLLIDYSFLDQLTFNNKITGFCDEKIFYPCAADNSPCWHPKVFLLAASSTEAITFVYPRKAVALIFGILGNGLQRHQQEKKRAKS